MAHEERADRATQGRLDRSFQATEARYADRRDAVVGLVAAAEEETDKISRFESEETTRGLAPGDVLEEYSFSDLNVAYARLAVLADTAVTEVGRAFRDAVYDCYYGRENHWPAYREALDTFQRSARAMLSSDAATLEA